jgi:hypothetical protein
MKRNRLFVTFAMAAAALFAGPSLAPLAATLWADEPSKNDQAENNTSEDTSEGTSSDEAAVAAEPAKPVPKLPEPKGAKRLSPEYDVWIDPKRKAVIVDGQVSLREGMLEMFACTRNTKEHESIVSVNSKAFIIHAALLRLGAEQGRPAQFVPKYRPPSGSEIEVTVEWRDEQGNLQTARAQDWIRDINTEKAMKHPFVFAGSSFWTDEETGKKFYQAEAGDLICVSNFSTAMLDIPVESSPENSELAFEAFTKRIPPLGAPVRLIMKPKLEKAGNKKPGAKSDETKNTQADNKVGKTSNAPKPQKDETR